jgi:hypothetical protein
MTSKQAYQLTTAFIGKAIRVNLDHNETQLAYQKHLLLSFANSLVDKSNDYQKNFEVLITMLIQSIEINLRYKEVQQADQLQLILEMARGFEGRINGIEDSEQTINISLN